MTPIRLLLVDDEPLAHQVLEGYARSLDYLEVVGNCYDGLSTLNFLHQHPVDAILLDIQMPDLTGIELAEHLRQEATKIIFVSAHVEFALQSFEFDQVVDYIHKPVRINRFIKAMERLRRQLELERQISTGPAPEKPSISPSPHRTITLRENKIAYKIKVSDLSYVQSWGNYIKVFQADGQVRVVRSTIREMEETLAPDGFVRIHKSYLVNPHFVLAVEGNVVHLPEMHLPMGKSYARQARKLLLGHAGGR